jgi:nucleotide-binding universal stress UspA family protein
MFKRILVPTDGSRLSQKAVEKAITLARITGASLVALHVYPRYTSNPYASFGPSDEVFANARLKQERAEANRIFGRIQREADAAGVSVEPVLAQSNDVHRQVIAVAREKKCDLICMASHGRRGISGVLLGSETQKVLIHSSIPVLVLR